MKFGRYYFIFLFIIPVIGSIFGVSYSFTDPKILPKWIFTFWGLSALGFYLSMTIYSQKINRLHSFDGLLFIILVICAFEAFWGIVHFIIAGTEFKECGTFDNPAGFATCLSSILPFAFYFREKGCLRVISNFFIMLFFSAVLISGSRTGFLSLITSIVICKKRLLKKYVGVPKNKWLFVILTLLLLILLYYVKQNSSDGRILIWCSSIEMILDSPLLGHGFGAIEREYMNYQSAFLQRFPYEHWQMIADNTKHLFNEYLEVFVEYGFVGFSIVACLFFFVVRTYKFCISIVSTYALISLVVIGIIAFFSYPFTYPFTWIIVILDILIIISDVYSNSICRVILQRRLFLSFLLCFISLLMGYKTTERCLSEIEWTRLLKNMQIDDNIRLREYERIEERMLTNPYFLYNYAVEAYLAGHFKLSLSIADRCSRKWADYDLELLKAICCKELNDLASSELYLIRAQKMCPNRFEPLYQRVHVYMKQGRIKEAKQIGESILKKKIKVPSREIEEMKNEIKTLF